MKKVLFVATVDSHIELFHLPFLKMFKEKGWETSVATESDKPIKYCDKKISMPIKRSPFKLISNFKAIRKLRKVIKEEKYDIIHCHTPMGGVVARMAARSARKNGTRVIYTAHGFHFYKGAPLHFWLMFYPVEWYLANYTDTLITINNEDFERAKKKFGKRCKDIQYVPGVGVDPKKFEKKMSAKEKAALRNKLGLNNNDKVLICIGRLDKNKNQGFLIRVMDKLTKIDPSYHLLLVGPDEINGEYHKLVYKLGLEKNIHFLGFRKDIPELLQISDIAVSTSKREGLPVNLIEAAMLGLPIVATDCRGNRDVCGIYGSKTCKRDDLIEFVRRVVDVGSSNKNEFIAFSLQYVCEKMAKVYFRKKRILHVLASNSFSGAENVACTIMKCLSDEFDSAYCSPIGPIKDKLKDMNIKYYEISKLNYRAIKKVVDEFNPDIIHAHDFRASMVVAGFSKKIKVSQLHKNDPKMRKVALKSTIYFLETRKFTKIVGVSDAILDECFYKNFIKKKYVTIPNYVDRKEVLKKADAFKVNKKYDLFFFGRLSDEKNPLEFIDIVKALKDGGLKLKSIMIGGGPLYIECKERIREYGLDKMIDLTGFQSNPYPYIKASRIGVMPSRFEGFGLAAVEASVLGKPVLNSGVGGLENVFEKKEEYICRSFEEYVKKIEYFLNDSDNLINACPVDCYCDKYRYVKKLMDLYEQQ